MPKNALCHSGPGPEPHRLVRYGVAPDHPHTRRVQRLFGHIERQPGFRYRLGVEVGRDTSLGRLRQDHDAVVYAVGAAFTLPELIGLAGLVDDGRLDVVVDTGGGPVVGDGARVDLLRGLAAWTRDPGSGGWCCGSAPGRCGSSGATG